MDHLSLSQAQQLVLAHSPVSPLVEAVSLAASVGRVLAAPVYANRDLPPCDISAMDGYALRAADALSVPFRLQIVGDIKAGDKPNIELAAGQCVRIMTGAPLPSGADAVIRVEDTELLSPDQVLIQVPVKAGNDVRYRGESMKTGEVVLNAGTEISPGVVGVLASVKQRRVPVYAKPRVAILSTGDELEALEAPVDLNKIPDANSYTLMAQLQQLGLEPELLGIAPDEPEALRQYLRAGLDYDVLLISGGTSVGVHDYVCPTLDTLGAKMLFWRVAIKPGHPVAFGRLANTLLFGLPGNPVSSMVCFELLVLPALRRLMGHSHCFRRQVQAQLTHHIKHRAGRAEFVRVRLSQAPDGSYRIQSTGPQGSGMLLSMVEAEGLAHIPAHMGDAASGSLLSVLLLDRALYQSC